MVDGELSPAAVVSAAWYSVPPTPVLLPLPGFATRDFELVDIASSVVPYPCSLVLGFVLDDFDSECSWGAMSGSPVTSVIPVIMVDVSYAPVSMEVVDWRAGELPSPDFDAELSTITSRFSPLHWPESPDAAETVVGDCGSQMLPVTSRGGGVGGDPSPSQPADVSSMDFSPVQVPETLANNTVDVCPVFLVSPRADGYVPRMCPVSMPDSPADQSLGSLLDCSQPICPGSAPDVIGGLPVVTRARGVSDTSGRGGCAGPPCSTCLGTDGGHGSMASPG